MSSLDSLWTVNIRGSSTRPTRRGFGTTLLAGYHTKYADLTREYDGLSGMLDDGFTANDALYKMAQAVFSQKPRPRIVKIGKLTSAVAWASTITITTDVEGRVISFTIIAPDGTSTAISYTVLAGATTTTVATAVELLVEAVVGIDSTSAGAVITATGPADGTRYYVKDAVNCTVIDTTADANVDTDLTAIETADNDWYWLAIAPKSEVNLDDVAAWTETRDKVFLFSTADHVERSASTIFTGHASAAYENTFGIFSLDQDHYAECALAGRLATMEPGRWTAKFQRLRGVTPDTFTATQRSYLENAARNGNYYEDTAGIKHLAEGKVASGEWLDTVTFKHWLKFRIQENLLGIKAAAAEAGRKIGYTDAGLAILRAGVQAVLDEGTSREGDERGFNPGDGDEIDPPTATVAAAADADPTDKANRVLRSIRFSGTLAGAVHGGIVDGEVLV